MDTRFWSRRDAHLFVSVIREVFDKSHTYCNLYIPKLDHPLSNYDPLLGEAVAVDIVYYKVSRVRVLAQIVHHTFEAGDRGAVSIQDTVEYIFRISEIEPFYEALFQSLTGSIHTYNFVAYNIKGKEVPIPHRFNSH